MIRKTFFISQHFFISLNCFSTIVLRPQVRWGDKHGGYGEHYWEYNHGPSKYHAHGKEDKHPVEYAPPAAPSYPASI